MCPIVGAAAPLRPWQRALKPNKGPLRKADRLTEKPSGDMMLQSDRLLSARCLGETSTQETRPPSCTTQTGEWNHITQPAWLLPSSSSLLCLLWNNFITFSYHFRCILNSWNILSTNLLLPSVALSTGMKHLRYHECRHHLLQVKLFKLFQTQMYTYRNWALTSNSSTCS